MRAWMITDGFGLANLKLEKVDEPELKDHQVRVKIQAASLNYRDLMVLSGHYNPKQPLPLIPLSDGAGVVVEVGSKVKKVGLGDKVCATFSQSWSHGPPTTDTYKNTLGSPVPGMLKEHGVFHEDGLVKYPEHLDFIEASTLPCAGVTAFNAIMCQGLKSGDTVLLQGTGGVSLFSLQLAKVLGLNIIITSSSDEKLKKAQDLGASQCINYIKCPDWAKEVQNLTQGFGVDAVVEVGGAKTLASSIRSVKKSGAIYLIGVLSGALEPLDLRPVLMNNLNIQGIFVGSKAEFIGLNRVVSHAKLRPVIDKVFSFNDAPEAFSYLSSAKHFGKVCISF